MSALSGPASPRGFGEPGGGGVRAGNPAARRASGTAQQYQLQPLTFLSLHQEGISFLSRSAPAHTHPPHAVHHWSIFAKHMDTSTDIA